MIKKLINNLKLIKVFKKIIKRFIKISMKDIYCFINLEIYVFLNLYKINTERY